jgi:uncharacterized protein YbaR (Trm112 family)
MVAKELLDLLACPATRQPLSVAPAELLARLNRVPGLENQGGARVRLPLAEGLLRADGRMLYPVQDGIPMLLVEEGIAIP